MEEVRRLRREKGWNQNELAFHADLAPSVISLLETGKREPNASTLRKLATALDVEIPDLFGRSESPKERTLPQSPSTKRDAEAGEPIDYRERYFELGRRQLELLEETLDNVREALGTEDYDEFIKLPIEEQHQRIKWARRLNDLAEEIIASIEDDRVELLGERRDELAYRRETLATTIEKFGKTA